MSLIQEKVNQGFQFIGEQGFGMGEGQAPIDPRNVVVAIISLVLGVIGFLFLILILWSGYLWITAYGEEEKAKRALGIARTAIIGLFLVFMSYAITIFIFTALTRSAGGVFYYDPQRPGPL